MPHVAAALAVAVRMSVQDNALRTLGWNAAWAESFAPLGERGLVPARVIIEDKHRYMVWTEQGELSGIVAGKVLHQAKSTAELPKVGDWVAVSPRCNEEKSVIHHILPRRSKLVRKVPGRGLEEQVLAANVDVIFVVQALDQSFNLRRLERYLVMACESGATPVVVLNKADLCEDLEARRADAGIVAGDTTVMAVSAKTGGNLRNLEQQIRPGETVVFVGSSGVGKSSLINRLCGEELQPTLEVRPGDSKGRHSTTWRELFLLPRGGLVIDTPGLRELQMWLGDEGLPGAFADIEELTTACHFRDCSHTVEKRCGVLAAVAEGRLPQERYQSYLKLKRELAHVAQGAKHRLLDRKRRTKTAQRAFNKMKRGAGS